MIASEGADDLLIRLDPFIPIGTPISRRHAVPIIHYERLSTILKGMSYQDAKSTYPEIRRLLRNLGQDAAESEAPMPSRGDPGQQ